MSALLPPQPLQSSLLSVPFAYVVAFSLNGPPPAYRDFFQELKQCDLWFNYVPGVWIVITRMTMVDLTVRLRGKIRITDRLMVMPAKGPVDGWLPREAWEWLNENLLREW